MILDKQNTVHGKIINNWIDLELATFGEFDRALVISPLCPILISES